MPSTTFPRQHARTRRFTLGHPRNVTIVPATDAEPASLIFLRSRDGEDPTTLLWSMDLGTGDERLLVDPALLGSDDDLPPEERARRERARETAGGVVAYTTDAAVRTVAFALGGSAWVMDLGSGETRTIDGAERAFLPRLDPTGSRVAWVADGGLWIRELGSEGAPHCLASDEDPEITWGAAEFVAAEEMGRSRGFWFSPDGERVVAARVDTTEVPSWHIADPANPDRPAVGHRYPASGATNADVRLFLLSLNLGEHGVEILWDREEFEYLAEVVWDEGSPLTLLVQSRDQTRMQLLTVDVETGVTTVVAEELDHRWLDLVPGTPAWSGNDPVLVLPDARSAADVSPEQQRLLGGTNALVVGDEAVTPAGLQVRSVLEVTAETITFSASGADPSCIAIHRWDRATGQTVVLHGGDAVRRAVVRGDVRVVSTSTLEGRSATTVISSTGERVIAGQAATALVTPKVQMLRLGDLRLAAALLLPTDDDGTSPLPVLLDPYGGPHAQRVLRSRESMLVPQWFADQGFAVLVVDGRGTPGRGPAFDRAVHGDLASGVLQDQIDALQAAAELEPRLDLTRVAMRGWSFGGYLSALAVLRRPDVFRAAIAGAPVTDWALYDTHYTERYLGTPSGNPEAYRRSSLVDVVGNLLGAVEPEGPDPSLLLIHGLADDNVVAAHSLRLSSALLAAGRSHTFLPLSGVTHMTPQEVVAENLLILQRDFLRSALG